ncbi:MFS transporter [Deinococcus sonorensis]|uniref:MFS transporter n=2 Tax=Deinococcus sonorensis TaxID=309891 RepID=A0AAU7UEJ3_9DEIO
MSTNAASSGHRWRTFEALGNREFRWLWLALLVSAVGTWMQVVTLSLLVLRITKGSTLALGSVSLTQALAFVLFSFVGGSVADRFDKRKLLLVTQSLLGLGSLALGLLAVTNHASLWSILCLAFFSSAVLSFDQPTRSALVPLLVPEELLTNAVALQSVAFSAAAAVGPALAGFLSGPLGLGGIFLLDAASFAGMLIVLWRIRLSGRAAARDQDRSFLESLKEVFQVIRQDPALPWLISGYAAVLFFGPSVSLILPIFAQRVLHLNNAGLGWLFTAVGLGTILGGLTVASLREMKRRGLIFLLAAAVWVGALVWLGLSHTLLMALGALFVFGVALNTVQSISIALMQGRVEERLRGRIMSVNTLLMMGLRPLGDFPAGALAGAMGPGGVVLLGAGIVAAFMAFLGTRKGLREV